jgi:hypothetical protein
VRTPRHPGAAERSFWRIRIAARILMWQDGEPSAVTGVRFTTGRRWHRRIPAVFFTDDGRLTGLDCSR